MNKIIILSSFLIAGNFFAQKKKIQLSNNSKISNQAISKNGHKSKSSEDVKKDLIKSQKILKLLLIRL